MPRAEGPLSGPSALGRSRAPSPPRAPGWGVPAQRGARNVLAARPRRPPSWPRRSPAARRAPARPRSAAARPAPASPLQTSRSFAAIF